MYEIKTEDVYEDFSKDKKIFNFCNYSANSKYYDDSNKLVFGKMRVEEFDALKPNMYSFLADDINEHKKQRV